MGILCKHFDVGWPCFLAGVLMLLAAGVIPSQTLLEEEEFAVQKLRMELARVSLVAKTYTRFLDEVDRGEETVVLRLAAAQLGVIPTDRQPLLESSGLSEPPTRWIERAALTDPETLGVIATPPKRSKLARILDGSGRLWVFGGALLSIFIGLLFSATDCRKKEGPFAASKGSPPDGA
jgi:hypothetical protein